MQVENVRMEKKLPNFFNVGVHENATWLNKPVSSSVVIYEILVA